MGYSGREKSLRILLRCTLNALTKCRVRKLLFDPRIHGYDGENDGCASITGEGEPIEFSKDVGTVIVNYSYQGIENYEELISDGVKNPQDYFDTFTAYFARKGGRPIDVVSYECA